MANYYEHIKDEKLKKLIRAQRIITWIPLLGSVVSIVMIHSVLHKRHIVKLFKFDMVLFAVTAGLVGLYLLMKFIFPKVLPPGADGLIYITAFVLVIYFATLMGVQDEIRTVYELQEGIIEPPDGRDADAITADRKAAAKPEAARRAAAEPAAVRKAMPEPAAMSAADGAAAEERERGEESILPASPVIERARVARMIREDTERTLRAGMPKRTKNIVGHEDKILRTLKVYMTAERQAVLVSTGTAIDFALLWIINDEKSRRTEVLYSRPVLKKGYTCYFSLNIRRGASKNGILFKLSEIVGSSFPGLRHRKFYQTEEIIKVVKEYLE